MATRECITHDASSSQSPRTPLEALLDLSRGVSDAVRVSEEVGALIHAAEGHTGRPSDVLNTLKATKERHQALAAMLSDLDMQTCDVEDGFKFEQPRTRTP